MIKDQIHKFLRQRQHPQFFMIGFNVSRAEFILLTDSGETTQVIDQQNHHVWTRDRSRYRHVQRSVLGPPFSDQWRLTQGWACTLSFPAALMIRWTIGDLRETHRRTGSNNFRSLISQAAISRRERHQEQVEIQRGRHGHVQRSVLGLPFPDQWKSIWVWACPSYLHCVNTEPKQASCSCFAMMKYWSKFIGFCSAAKEQAAPSERPANAQLRHFLYGSTK